MNSLLNNIGFSALTFINRLISGSLVYIILARYISINDFGLLSFGTTLAGLLTVIAEFGFSLMSQRDIPQKLFFFKEYVANTFLQKGIFSILSLLGGILYLSIFYKDLNYTIGIIFTVNAIITANNMYLFAVFRAKNLFKYESILSLIYSVLIIILIFIYFIAHQDLLFLAYGLLLFRFVQLVVLIIYFKKEFGSLNFRINKSIQLYLFKNSFSFGFHYIIGIFYLTIDNQFLAYFSGNEAIAMYQAFFKIVFLLLSINDVLINVFLPYLSSRYKSNLTTFIKTTTLINKMIISVGISLFVFLNFFAVDIVKTLYSEKYSLSLTLTLPLGFVLLFRVISSVYSVILTISHHQNVRVFIVFITLLVNISLNLFFRPIYSFLGAAYVSMVTHLILVGLYIYFTSRFIHSHLLEKKTLIYLSVTLLLIITYHVCNVEIGFIWRIAIFIGWLFTLKFIYLNIEFAELKSILTREKYL